MKIGIHSVGSEAFQDSLFLKNSKVRFKGFLSIKISEVQRGRGASCGRTGHQGCKRTSLHDFTQGLKH